VLVRLRLSLVALAVLVAFLLAEIWVRLEVRGWPLMRLSRRVVAAVEAAALHLMGMVALGVSLAVAAVALAFLPVRAVMVALEAMADCGSLRGSPDGKPFGGQCVYC